LLLARESESRTLEQRLDQIVARDGTVTSVWLLETELRRAARRLKRSQVHASAVLDRISLAEMDRATYTQAGLIGDDVLRALDALHVATAIHIGSDRLISYDVRQLEAARSVGLAVESPR